MGNMELLATALEYLETHLEEDLRTEDVAKACFCSKSTLEKLFKCVNGIGVHDYLVRRRMMKAARCLVSNPEQGILEIALQFGYSTNESFTRAFKQVWNCNPSEFRGNVRFTELFPRRILPSQNGDAYMNERMRVDISELYDLFVQRKDCYFICCDIQYLLKFNEISRKAGDLAILTELQRMTDAAGEEDVIFRIGADEFVLLTNSKNIAYAESVAEKIRLCNGQMVEYEGKELPLSLYVTVTKFEDKHIRYNELFSDLQKAIDGSKYNVGYFTYGDTKIPEAMQEKGVVMDISDIYAIEDETKQVQEIYKVFNENVRLNRSKAARVEFLTTIRYIEKYLKTGDKILDIGAGAGEYSFHFARKGYEVTAVELADANIEAFRKKIMPEDTLTLLQGNALDLSAFPDDAFDIVLLFGPLYHLHSDEDKLKCLEEAKRVCKENGKIFCAFITNDFIPLTEFVYDKEYFMNGDYDKETFRLNDFPFVFHTLDAARELLQKGSLRVLHEVASDGASELLADKINQMDEENYRQYLRHHFYTCEKPEFLGMSNHWLFVGEK